MQRGKKGKQKGKNKKEIQRKKKEEKVLFFFAGLFCSKDFRQVTSVFKINVENL